MKDMMMVTHEHQSHQTMFSENLKKWGKTLAMVLLPVTLVGGVVWCVGGLSASEQALAHAQRSRDEVSYVRFELDLDDFIPRYEVSWYEGTREVECTVHALTGQLIELDWDA